MGNFGQNLAQNWADWNTNGSLFLGKLVFVWVHFQNSQQQIPTKTKLRWPPRNLQQVVAALDMASIKPRKLFGPNAQKS